MSSKKNIQLCSLWLVLGLLLSLFSCQAVFASAEPVINYFYGSTDQVAAGETVTLKWQTTNVSRVEIIGLEKQEELLTSGELEVWPLTTTTYVLVAYGNNGIVISKAFAVNVGATGNVKVDFFKSSKTVVAPGETVTLSWRVLNGKNVKLIGIEQEPECIKPIEGEIEVWPLKTTTYILQANGLKGEIHSASVTVNVKENIPQPEILTFEASKTVISKGEMITLSWTTKNAVECRIETNMGHKLPNRPPNGSVSVTPNKSLDYTLIAIGSDGTETRKTIPITVNK